MPNKATEEYNLVKVYPDVLKFWDKDANNMLSPSQMTPATNKKVAWTRKCNTHMGEQIHKWVAPVDWTVKNNFRCPYCASGNGRLLEGFNDLESQFPKIAAEWAFDKNIKIPSEVFSKSTQKFWWTKECVPNHKYGVHSWYTSINSRTSKNTGCPICAGQKVMVGFNDLASQHPEVSKQWHPTLNGSNLPTETTSYVIKKAWWLCDVGHEWEASISSRTKENTGCPVCSNQKVLSGYNDLATLNPELAKKWSPNNIKQANEVTQFTHKKFLWVGDCRHEWDAAVADMNRGRDCPYCAPFNSRLLIGFNDLASQYPDIAKNWHPTKNKKTPQMFSKASETKVWWLCDEGHEYQAWINIKTHQKTGCPICSNRKVLEGFNDLASVSPELAKQLSTKNNIKTNEIYSHSAKRVIWVCDKGHEWKQQIDVRQRGIDCPECYSRTSKSESLLREAFRPVLKNVNKSHTQKIDIEGIKHKKQIDIFAELEDGRKIIIEYDGWYWHREKLDRDTRESKAMLKAGYILVRVREHSGSKVLEPVKIRNKNFLSLSAKHINSEETAQLVVMEVLKWLNS